MSDHRMELDQPPVAAVQPGLRRALGTWGAAAFVVTNMVGTGIFTVPAFVRSATGDGPTALGVWAVGALLALCGALVYAELATRMPEAGGEYHYLTRVYGRLWGFLSGWISFFVGFSSAIAASALGAAAYVEAIFPGWQADQPWLSLGGGFVITQGAAAAGVLVVTLTVFHSAGVRPSGRLQSIFAAAVIGAIVLFVFAGMAGGRGDWRGVTADSQVSGPWWVAVLQVNFAYSGWNAAAYLAGETADPRRTLPRALIGGTLIVALLYLGLNLIFLYAIPADSWTPSIAVGAQAAEVMFGPAGKVVVSAIITVMIIGSVSSMVAAGPRVYYAMARDGMAPAVFAKLHPRTGAPIAALLVQAAVAGVLALTGAFGLLLTYAGSALLLFTGLGIATIYTARRKAMGDARRIFRAPGYPFTPAIYIILVVVAWFQGLKESPTATGAALITIGIGAIIYFVGRAGGWIGSGPNVAETSD